MLNKWASDPIEIAGFKDVGTTRTGFELRLVAYVIEENAKKVLNNKGIYFICCTNPKAVYPVYVGITSQTFFKRLSKHKEKGGVLARIYDEKWGLDVCQDFTLYVKKMDIPAAKFLESTFLAAFDFARNKEENDERRTELVQNGGKIDGSEHFFETLKTKNNNLQDAINELKALERTF